MPSVFWIRLFNNWDATAEKVLCMHVLPLAAEERASGAEFKESEDFHGSRQSLHWSINFKDYVFEGQGRNGKAK